MKLSVEIKNKALVVDEEVFDWAIEEEELVRARKYVGQNPTLKKAVYNDIITHFVDSFSEFLGKAVSLRDINLAIAEGFIDK